MYNPEEIDDVEELPYWKSMLTTKEGFVYIYFSEYFIIPPNLTGLNP